MTCLVREFLEFFHLDYTTAVFDPETGLVCQSVTLVVGIELINSIVKNIVVF